MNPAIILTILIIMLTGVCPAYALMYSWTDAEGVKHYSNQSPNLNTAGVSESSEMRYDENADKRRTAEDDRLQQEFLRQTDTVLKPPKQPAAEATQDQDQAAPPKQSTALFGGKGNFYNSQMKKRVDKFKYKTAHQKAQRYKKDSQNSSSDNNKGSAE